MAVISTRLHGAGDYATGVGLLAVPHLLGVDDPVAAGVLRGTGAAILGLSAVTDYELGILRRLPMPVHLFIDAATGATLAAGGGLWLRRRGGGVASRLRRRGGGTMNWLPHVVVGAAEIGAAALTSRRPSDHAPDTASAGGDRGAQAGAGDGEGTAARTPDRPTPGSRESTEADDPRRRLPAELPSRPEDEFDPLVAREEAAAAAAAARIGGAADSPVTDPAMDPVYQAGGGEQDGWEQAEDLLIENASHGDGYADPERDAFSPERESDRSTAAYGEPDAIRSTELEDERVADAQGDPSDAQGDPSDTQGDSSDAQGGTP